MRGDSCSSTVDISHRSRDRSKSAPGFIKNASRDMYSHQLNLREMEIRRLRSEMSRLQRRLYNHDKSSMRHRDRKELIGMVERLQTDKECLQECVRSLSVLGTRGEPTGDEGGGCNGSTSRHQTRLHEILAEMKMCSESRDKLLQERALAVQKLEDCKQKLRADLCMQDIGTSYIIGSLESEIRELERRAARHQLEQEELSIEMSLLRLSTDSQEAPDISEQTPEEKYRAQTVSVPHSDTTTSGGRESSEELVLDSADSSPLLCDGSYLLDILHVPARGACAVYQVTSAGGGALDTQLHVGDYLLVWHDTRSALATGSHQLLTYETLDGSASGVVASDCLRRIVGEELVQFHQECCLRDTLVDVQQQSSCDAVQFCTSSIGEQTTALLTSSAHLLTPPVAPRGLRILACMSRAVLVSWCAPPCDHIDASAILCYHIYVNASLYTRVDGGEPRLSALIDLPASALCVSSDSRTVTRVSVCLITTDMYISPEAACTLLIAAPGASEASEMYTQTHTQQRVTGLCVSRVDTCSAQLSWLPADSRMCHALYVNCVRVCVCGPGVFQHVLGGLQASTHYSVRVLACLPTAPAAPYAVSCLPGPTSVTAEDTVLVSWVPVVGDIHGYCIYADTRHMIATVYGAEADHTLVEVSRLVFDTAGTCRLTVRTQRHDGTLSEHSQPPCVITRPQRLFSILEEEGGVVDTQQPACIPLPTQQPACIPPLTQQPACIPLPTQQPACIPPPTSTVPHITLTGCAVTSQPGHAQQTHPQTLPPSTQQDRLYVALYDYNPYTMSPNPDTCEQEMALYRGELVHVRGAADADGFFWGSSGARSGYVPSNMVSEVQMAPAQQEQCSLPHAPRGAAMLALYDYDPNELSPNVDAEVELSFCAGDVIHVLGQIDDDGFYMGVLNGRRGLVPSNFLAALDAPHTLCHADSLVPTLHAPPIPPREMGVR